MRAAAFSGADQAYEIVPLAAAARRLLTPGTHTLAVQVHNARGARYVDVGMVDVTGW